MIVTLARGARSSLRARRCTRLGRPTLRPGTATLMLALVLALAPAVAPSVALAATITTRASVSATGAQGDGASYSCALSSDGTRIAFLSQATNLVTGDTNNWDDVLVRDTLANTTTRVSVDSGGAQGNGACTDPAISPDGRYVAFCSAASNLVPGDDNGTVDVFVRDTLANTTTRVSVDSAGVEAAGNSFRPSVCSGGRYVAFESDAANLVAGDTNGMNDVFVHDTLANTTTRVSVDSAGAEGDWGGNSWDPCLSADGRYVAFSSWATNLVAGDTNNTGDVFVRDTVASTTTRVSVDSAGAEGDAESYAPSISADGSRVAFASNAANLVASDTNGATDVFARDTLLSTTTRVSVDSAGIQGNSTSYAPSISADGEHVAFASWATNLIAGDTNGLHDVFFRSILANATTGASAPSGSDPGHAPSVSSDGRYVGFTSSASNLVAGDTNGMTDVFVLDSDAPGAPPTTTTPASGPYTLAALLVVGMAFVAASHMRRVAALS